MNVMLHDLKYEIKKLADDGAISVSSYDEIKRTSAPMVPISIQEMKL